MSFGSVLKKIRTEKNDTVRKLAEKAGMSFSFISRVEKGTAPVSENFVKKLIKAYPDKADELLNAYLDMKTPTDIKKKVETGIELLENSSPKKLINFLLDQATHEEIKSFLEFLLLQTELRFRKNGTYEKMKNDLELIKKEIEKL